MHDTAQPDTAAPLFGLRARRHDCRLLILGADDARGRLSALPPSPSEARLCNAMSPNVRENKQRRRACGARYRASPISHFIFAMRRVTARG